MSGQGDLLAAPKSAGNSRASGQEKNARSKQPVVFYWRRYAVDAVAWFVALVLGTLIRFDGATSKPTWSAVAWVILIAVALQLLFGLLFRVYRGRHPWGSFEGLLDVILTSALTGAVLWIYTTAAADIARVPRSLALIATPIAMILMAGARYLVRYITERERKAAVAAAGEPTLLYGAGYVGDHMSRLMTTDVNSPLSPVGILDDDPLKRHLRLHGVPVLGTLADLPTMAQKTDAKTLVVAIGDPSTDLLDRVQSVASEAGVRVLLTPSTEHMMRDGVNPSDLRDLDILDLLGRDQVDTDVSAIAGYLNGKTVLVTGAGGSIGSQLCVEISKHGPAELILLDHDETNLQSTEIRIKGDGLLDTNEVVLASIRDAETIRSIFAERKPDVVFHAAALKHLPMLEQYPEEAWQTNVLGTLNVLEAAHAAGVKTLINISTDKAANPTSVLGLSKRFAERLTAAVGNGSGVRYLSVRFGNVIGSRGSMLPTFRTLIEAGRPLTVTHPDITRYFMTIPEACQLVLQAGAIGRAGEVLILDMGDPVRILDIAQKMIDISGKDIEIHFTGLREGEKLHEDLHSEFEVEEAPFHAKISHAAVQGLTREDLDRADWEDLIHTDPADRPARAFQQQSNLGAGGSEQLAEVRAIRGGQR